jgi:hypothetical protein
VIVTLWEMLLLVSVPVMVIVTLPDGVVLVVWTVNVAEPEPPVMLVVSKVATTFEFDDVAVSETVPVKLFTACTLTVNVANEPAVTVWDVGLADRVNSELLPPLPEPDPTVRRGEITHPWATSSRTVKKNASLRMHIPLFQQPYTALGCLSITVLKQNDNFIGLSSRSSVCPGMSQELVRVQLFCKTE